MLTDTQKQTLANALRAETNQTVVDALAIRNDVALAEWTNANSTADAWNNSMDARSLFQAMDITKYDNLTAGKRDAWRCMLDYAPHDMAKNANRKAALDIWGAADSVAVLQSCVRKATKGENYLGGTSATTNTVTALKLNFSGYIPIQEVSESLNRF
ncbi:MAG TPA: hypothetical protein PKD38_13645 [Nitrospira sp.]|nr:hypothetical protein [Nitrospira sp.]